MGVSDYWGKRTYTKYTEKTDAFTVLLHIGGG